MATNSQPKDIILHETFEGGLKYSLYANFKKWTEAFLELLDNAVSNRILDKQISIEILTSAKILDIVNRGGYGMNLAELQEFLQWGKIKERRAYDIGAYSQGGKSAMGYLGKSMRVKASPVGKKELYVIEDDDLHDYRLKSYKVMTLPTSNDGLVDIQVSGLKRKINYEELEALIANIYRPLIVDGSIKISHNGKKIEVDNFPVDPDFKIQNFDLILPKSKKRIWGWIGRLTPRSGVKGGIKCYKLGRLICDKEFFGHPDAHYKQTLNFLFGEIALDHIPATTNKTDFDRDSSEWEEVQAVMFPILKPHIDDLLGRDIQEPSDEEKDRIKNAKEIVAELLKLRKVELSGPAIVNLYDQGQKPKGKEGIPRPPSLDTQRKNNPKTPPPADSVGKRKRLREFMEWDIRPMDESLRSIIQSDGGKKILVINNLFPGFKVSKGNLVYLIETAAIQLSKPEEDEKLTVDEYIESFDNLYSFFCTNLDTAKENIQKKKQK